MSNVSGGSGRGSGAPPAPNPATSGNTVEFHIIIKDLATDQIEKIKLALLELGVVAKRVSADTQSIKEVVPAGAAQTVDDLGDKYEKTASRSRDMTVALQRAVYTFGSATDAGRLVVGTMMSLIYSMGPLTAAIGVLTIAYQLYTQKSEEQRRLLAEEAKDWVRLSSSVEEYIKKRHELMNMRPVEDKLGDLSKIADRAEYYLKQDPRSRMPYDTKEFYDAQAAAYKRASEEIQAETQMLIKGEYEYGKAVSKTTEEIYKLKIAEAIKNDDVLGIAQAMTAVFSFEEMIDGKLIPVFKEWGQLTDEQRMRLVALAKQLLETEKAHQRANYPVTFQEQNLMTDQERRKFEDDQDAFFMFKRVERWKTFRDVALSATEQIADLNKSKAEAIADAYKRANESVAASLKGMIEGLLQFSEVTPEDVEASRTKPIIGPNGEVIAPGKPSTYQDKPDEPTRRLKVFLTATDDPRNIDVFDKLPKEWKKRLEDAWKEGGAAKVQLTAKDILMDVESFKDFKGWDFNVIAEKIKTQLREAMQKKKLANEIWESIKNDPEFDTSRAEIQELMGVKPDEAAISEGYDKQIAQIKTKMRDLAKELGLEGFVDLTPFLTGAATSAAENMKQAILKAMKGMKISGPMDESVKEDADALDNVGRKAGDKFMGGFYTAVTTDENGLAAHIARALVPELSRHFAPLGLTKE